MSEYIINPMWFYWFQLCDSISFSLALIGVISLIVISVGMLLYFFDDDKVPKFVYISAILSVLMIILAAIIPSKETLIQMLVAKAATKQNIALTVDGIKEVIDYIIAAFASLK